MAKRTVPVSFINDVGAVGATVSDSGAVDGAADSNREPELISGFESIDPAGIDPDIGSGNSDSGTRRRRGRPPGSGTGTRQKKTQSNLSIETVLFSFHMMAATFFDASELVLSEGECTAYADAIKNVSAQYNHNIDPRVMAWGNLALVAGGIYGTRIFAIRNRMKAEDAKTPDTKVISMPSAATAAAKQAPSKTVVPVGVARTPADMYGYGYSGAVGDSD